MQKDIFGEETEKNESRVLSIGRAIISPSFSIEKAGYFIAAVILLVVIVVMTTDIRAVTVQNIKDLSLSMFVLFFCSYAMYGNMYKSGTLAGENVDAYKEVCKKYDEIRSEIITQDTQKDLSLFCREYVMRELQDRIEDVLIPVSISLVEYEEYKHLTRAQLEERKLSKPQIRRILMANKIRPVKLTPELLCKQGRVPIKRGLMHILPSHRRKKDYMANIGSALTASGAIGFMAFEVFSNPSWSTFCAVVFKVFAVAFTGFSGYVKGYDLITTYTVLFTQDQIDILNQFKAYRSAKQNGGKEECEIA